MIQVSEANEPIAKGPFAPTWDSLAQYKVPEWFRDAKFGIWAHWGPQCEPEAGDWYARQMYEDGSAAQKYHLAHYGSPKDVGFKEIIHQWKAADFDPDKLLALYKRAGAQYFFALANHHDNFDLWDSKYQPWNSVAIGPQKNIIDGWAKAARANGLKFGVSVHASHAWTWYEPSQNYDGNLTRADGKGLWWDGLDPQDLYAQLHIRGSAKDSGEFWEWRADKVTPPSQAYCDKFYDRTVDLINKYHPDLLYFDDTVLPLWPVCDAGLKIAAHYYNQSAAQHGGENQAVMFGKILDPEQRKCMVWDIERGQSSEIEPLPWQTDTCIGNWHYDRAVFDQHRYKSTATVIQTLADVVSKNGCLLLSVPLQRGGMPDSDELKIVEGIGDWMAVNREAIFSTRPWKVFGEGVATEDAAHHGKQNFNEGKGKPLTAEDFRFTQSGDTIYAICMGWPSGQAVVKSMGIAAKLLDKSIASVHLLGVDKELHWKQNADALEIEIPVSGKPSVAAVFKIETR